MLKNTISDLVENDRRSKQKVVEIEKDVTFDNIIDITHQMALDNAKLQRETDFDERRFFVKPVKRDNITGVLLTNPQIIQIRCCECDELLSYQSGDKEARLNAMDHLRKCHKSHS